MNLEPEAVEADAHAMLRHELLRLTVLAEMPVDVGPIEKDWTPLSELIGKGYQLAERIYARYDRDYAGMDLRGQGAFFIGGIAYVLATTLALIDQAGVVWPNFSRRQFAVTIGENGLRYRFDLDAIGDDQWSDGGAPAVTQCLEDMLTPLVEHLYIKTRLSRAAQWRLIADSFAGGMLLAGRTLGKENEAKSASLAALAMPEFKIANKQTGYLHIRPEGSENDVDGRAFLSRGGCCRFYTADKGSYCMSCVMRNKDDQAEQFARWMAQQTVAEE